MTVDELPLMLTVDEAAEVLRIGRNSAYAAVAEGTIPSVRIGRAIRIPRQSLAVALGMGDDQSVQTEAALGAGSASPQGASDIDQPRNATRVAQP